MQGTEENNRFGGGAACTLASQLEKGLQMMYNFKERNYTMGRRFGFTLAEVLITLAIIGVVAALTIPTLYGKYYERMTITNLKKTYAELQQIIKLSEIENGDSRNWEYDTYGTSKMFAEKYILPYYKKVEVCGHPKCFGDTYNWKNEHGDEVLHSYFPAVTHYKVNGKPIIIATNATNCTAGSNIQCSPKIKYVYFVIDVNYPHGNSIMGKDVFLFTLFDYKYKSPFNSYKPDGEHYGLYLGDICAYYGCYPQPLANIINDCKNSTNRFNCGLAIQKNGWKIPDDYPIKF